MVFALFTKQITFKKMYFLWETSEKRENYDGNDVKFKMFP